MALISSIPLSGTMVAFNFAVRCVCALLKVRIIELVLHLALALDTDSTSALTLLLHLGAADGVFV